MEANGDDGWAEDGATRSTSISRNIQSGHTPTAPKPTATLTSKDDEFDEIQAASVGHCAVAAIAELHIPRMFHGIESADAHDILVPDDMTLPQATRAASAVRRVLIRRGLTLAADRILQIRPRPPPAADDGDMGERPRARTDSDVHFGFDSGPPRMVHLAGEGPAGGDGGGGGGENAGEGGGGPTIGQRMVLLEGCGGSLVHLRLRADLAEPFDVLLEVLLLPPPPPPPPPPLPPKHQRQQQLCRWPLRKCMRLR